MTSHANLAKRIVFILFILTILSSVSAAYFVNVDINLTSAKKGSQSSGGDSKNKGNGDSVGSNGNIGSNTTTPSIAQGTTTTDTSGLNPPKAFNQCQSIITGPSDQCGLGNNNSPATSINGASLTPQQQYEQCLGGIGGGIPGNCKPPSSTSSSGTSINGASLTPQQQYEQCLGGIGGGIPGNCKAPPATTTEQNVPSQTLSPQQTCQGGSTPSANGICQDRSTPQQACPGNVGRDGNGICFSPAPIITCPLHTVRDATNDCVPLRDIGNGTEPIGQGKLRVPTVQPVPNTNTIAPICPFASHLVGAKCVLNGNDCPLGYTQDQDICTPTTPIHAKIFVPPCASGYSRDTNGECLPIPPATPPSNTPPGQP